MNRRILVSLLALGLAIVQGCATYTIRRAELTYDGDTDRFSRVHDVGGWIRRYDAESIVSFLTGEG